MVTDMNGKSSTAKGKRFENWICGELDAAGLGPARREIGSGNGKRKGDIAWPGLRAIEAKNESKIPAWLLTRIEHAKRQDIGHYGYVLVIRDPRASEANFGAFAVLDFGDYIELEKKAKEPALVAPTREMKYELQRLIQSAKAVLKNLEKEA